jgi:predicted ribosome quality control (RQC) complex YloA/Tae2 family protein
LWTATTPSLAEWLEELGDTGSEDAVGSVAYLSRYNRDFVFPDAAETDLKEAYDRYVALRRDIHADPPTGWLLGEGDDQQPYPSALGAVDAVPSTSLVEVLSSCLESGAHGPCEVSGVEDPEAAAVRQSLLSKRDRAARKLRALRAQLDEGSRATELREFGNLLLARKSQVRSGLKQVSLEDFAGDTVMIQLDPRLDVVGNADSYYRRARRLDRATRELPPRIKEVEERIAELDLAFGKLNEDGLSAELRELAGLDRQRLDARPGGERARLPYRVYRTSSGLEIRAGRSARDNDALTFKHSSSNDIWMHVRESPGSHVVLRWDNREQNPSPADLEEAAVVAAVLSRARGSGLVPVSWTRRKYVRKPRKAGPGSVVTQQTKTIFVEPDEKLVNRLAERE